MDKLRARNMFEEDEDFPGDDDETCLYLDAQIQTPLPSTGVVLEWESRTQNPYEFTRM